MTANKPWTGVCHRCGKPAGSHTMSRFDTALVCPDCETEERRHPDYERAVQADVDAVRHGDYNFPGIGWPGKATGMADIFGRDD